MNRSVLAGAALFLMSTTVAAQAQAPTQAPVIVRNPEWLRKPSYLQLSAAFPLGAQVRGKGAIDCFVTPQGILHDCRVSIDEPAGHGFGRAVLALSSQYIMKPAMRDGKPVEARTRIGVLFQTDGSSRRGLTETLINVLSELGWAKAPTVADVTAELDKKAGAKSADIDGTVLLQCALNYQTGTVSHCEAVDASPGMESFTETALSLTKKFRADKAQFAGLTGSVGRSLRVNLIFRFPDMHSQAWSQRYLRQYQWVHVMDANQAAQLYPAAAMTAGVKSGSAVVDCVATETGSLDGCEVLRESKAGVGLGEAAKRKVQAEAINPWDQGLPVDGAHVQVLVSLKSPEAGGPVNPTLASATPAPTPSTKP